MFAASKGVPGVVAVVPPTTEVGGLTLVASGTYSLVVPNGVYQVSALAIGGGGGAGGSASGSVFASAGGGGGALSYSNNLVVTPGETLTLVVGTGGDAGLAAGGTNGTSGGDSYIARGATNLVLAKGGSFGIAGGSTSGIGGGAGGSAASGVGNTKYSGGDGGNRGAPAGGGGGGAAGYSGNGGAGNNPSAPTAGSGGGGGGSYGYFAGGAGSNGGGTLFYGQGTSGAAGSGTSPGSYSSQSGGMGSSLGGATRFISSTTESTGPGGGGGGVTAGFNGISGLRGAVRVLWGNTPEFPSTSVTLNTLSVVASANSSGNTITIPSSVLPGDTVVLIDFSTQGGSISINVPTGFTQIATFDNNTGGGTPTFGRMTMSYKQILSAAEGGTSITGIGDGFPKKIMLVIRGSRGYGVSSSLSVGGTAYTVSTPPSQTASATSWDSYAFGIPIVIAGFYGSSGISTSTDISFSNGTFVAGPDNTFWVGYRIYSQSTTSYSDTISMTDRGDNALCVVSTAGY